MRLLVPVVDGGENGGGRRVNLPTYTIVELSDDGRFAVVDVPDADIDPLFPANLARRVAASVLGGDVSRLTAVQRLRWYAHLDARYQEHSGRFRPV